MRLSLRPDRWKSSALVQGPADGPPLQLGHLRLGQARLAERLSKVPGVFPRKLGAERIIRQLLSPPCQLGFAVRLEDVNFGHLINLPPRVRGVSELSVCTFCPFFSP